METEQWQVNPIAPDAAVLSGPLLPIIIGAVEDNDSSTADAYLPANTSLQSFCQQVVAIVCP